MSDTKPEIEARINHPTVQRLTNYQLREKIDTVTAQLREDMELPEHPDKYALLESDATRLEVYTTLLARRVGAV
jgi:hypothetical protein